MEESDGESRRVRRSFERARSALRWALPDVDLFENDMARDKARRMVELVRLHRGEDFLVLTGASPTLLGLDPRQVCAHAGHRLRGYSAALNRSVPAINEAWTRGYVLPTLHPRVVVLGIGAMEMNDNGLLQAWSAKVVERAPAYRPGLSAWLLRRYADACHRLHPTWHRPAAGTEEGVGGIADGQLDEAGMDLEMIDRTFSERPRFREFIKTQSLDGYEAGPVQRAAVRRTIEAAQAGGADVLMVEMPAAEAIFDLFPRGRTDHDAGLDAVADIAEQTGVRFLTADDSLRAEALYADFAHMNRAGVELMSSRVGAAVAEQLGKSIGAQAGPGSTTSLPPRL